MGEAMNTQASKSFWLIALNGNSEVEERLALDAVDISGKIVEGHWKGEKERSWIIDGKEERWVKGMAKARMQEAILFVDVRKQAWLFNAIDDFTSAHYQGLWKSVDASVALGQDSYTKDPSTGIYWVIQPIGKPAAINHSLQGGKSP